MDIILGNIVESESALVKLYNADLPIRESIRLKRFINEIRDDLAVFKEKRAKLNNRFYDFDGEGKAIPKDGVDLAEWQAEMKDLVSVDLDYEIEPIPVSAIPGDVKISGQELELLSWIIKED